MCTSCYNCEDRCVGCHGDCDRYKAYRANLKKHNEANAEYYDYLRPAMKRMKNATGLMRGCRNENL